MKPAFNRSILRSQHRASRDGQPGERAGAKATEEIRVRKQGILTHPPVNWFLGDENEAQKGLTRKRPDPVIGRRSGMMKKTSSGGLQDRSHASKRAGGRQMAGATRARVRRLLRSETSIDPGHGGKKESRPS